MEIMKLDAKDRQILYELDLNARQSDSEIAKKCRLSREVVAYRINRLQKEGIVRGFLTILNHHALGYLCFRVFLKFRDVSGEQDKELVSFMKKNVAWIVRVRGNWSYNFMAFTANIFHFERFIQEFKEKFQKNLVSMHFSLVTRIYHYRRAYLMAHEQDTSSYDVMGEAVQVTQIDEIDLKILDAIQNNGRLSSMEIAKKTAFTERIVRYRLRSLIDNKIILGFRAHLDLAALELTYYKLHFKLNAFDKELLKKIETYCHYHPDVVYKTDAIGGWDLELELQVPSSKQLYMFIDTFTAQFPGIVNDCDILEYEKEFWLSYLNKV